MRVSEERQGRVQQGGRKKMLMREHENTTLTDEVMHQYPQ